MFIDTHCHLNFNAFKEDSDDIIRDALQDGMRIIMPGSQYSTSRRAVEIAERYEKGIYAAVGLHPIHLGEKRSVDVLEVQSEEKEEAAPWTTFETRSEAFDASLYKPLAQSKKTVAIGEIGLDYYYAPKGKARRQELKELQEKTLWEQVRLAVECDLPVIFHCRVAHDDLLSFIRRFQNTEHATLRGVVHSYTGNLEQTKEFLDLGFSFGFNGLIFKNIPALPNPEDIISYIPMDRIVLETDAPYLIPPQANQERNEPKLVKMVAGEIGRIKRMSLEEVAKNTTENAIRIFFLPA